MPASHTQTGVLSFGYVAPHVGTSVRLDMATFWIEVGAASGLEIMVSELPSYETLTRAFAANEVDLAWLPPIPFLALERRKGAVPLVSHHRDGSSHFHSVLVGHRASGMKRATDVVGKRAAWVDQYSASGYVLPRIELAKLGIDPKSAFTTERFYRSHEAAVRAVLDKKADFAGTWVGRDASGTIVRAPWQDLAGAESIRILQTFGVIPSDTIAARATLPLGEAERVRTALMSIAGTVPNLVRDLFGVDEFRPWTAEGYDVLHQSTTQASKDGLLEGVEKVDRSSGKLDGRRAE
jgi:phosphate/phosphite/phosphonate ABC transporter binding protein